jgi:AraC-like DNA-binding protein
MAAADTNEQQPVSAGESIQSFSTQAVPRGMRLEYWLNVLGESLWPVTEWIVPGDFNVELREAPLGCLSLMSETIGPSAAHRTARDVENSRDRCYLLFANQSSWVMSHRGRLERTAPGDAVLVDSQGELLTSASSGFQGCIIKLPVDWIRSWLPDPELLVGRRIPWDSKWGPTFLPMVSQLTPELAAAPPLPQGVLVDQLGAMLALIVGDVETRTQSELVAKIRDCIRQRCSEPQLTAPDIAASLDVPPRVLHRVLATSDLTFASELLDARIRLARQMLVSPSLIDMPIIEIAHQTGFLSAAHFARATRKRTGHTPQELRQLTTHRARTSRVRHGATSVWDVTPPDSK